MTELPRWIQGLDEGDLQFLKRLVLASGSLKAVAKEYGISYPTVRVRLDRLIEKVHKLDTPQSKDPFQLRVELLVTQGRLSAGVARILLREHKKAKGGRGGA